MKYTSMFCLFDCHKIRPPTTNFLHKSPDRQSIIIPNNMRGLILRILLGFEIFMEKYSFMSEWWMKEFCNGFQFNNNQNLFALLLHTNFAFVFVYLCICVFVYLCICVFEYETLGNISFDILGPRAFRKYMVCMA